MLDATVFGADPGTLSVVSKQSFATVTVKALVVKVKPYRIEVIFTLIV